MAAFDKIKDFVDQNVPTYIKRLAEVVAIPSVSGMVIINWRLDMAYLLDLNLLWRIMFLETRLIRRC